MQISTENYAAPMHYLLHVNNKNPLYHLSILQHYKNMLTFAILHAYYVVITNMLYIPPAKEFEHVYDTSAYIFVVTIIRASEGICVNVTCQDPSSLHSTQIPHPKNGMLQVLSVVSLQRNSLVQSWGKILAQLCMTEITAWL